MPVNDVQTMTPKAMAKQIRDFAKEVESGNFIAVGFVLCDKDAGGGHSCFVDQNFATPELLDEMLHTLKTALFESYEDGK